MGEADARLREAFGERLEYTGSGRVSVAPATPGEVALATEIAQRHGLPLTLLGAGTAASNPARGPGLTLKLERLRGISAVEGESVEVEAGVPWVELEDRLRPAGKSLRVYPTSAPRSTVGGWLARDGLGVGSCSCGWLGENVVRAEVALPGGELRGFEGEDLGLVVGAEGSTGVIVRATLLLRDAAHDRPFAAAFETAGALARSIARIAGERRSLWHLGFASPPLALSAVERGYILFGVPEEPDLEPTSSGGEALPAAEAYRVWGTRYFPAGQTGELPFPAGALVPIEGLSEALDRIEREAPHLAIQGSVSRDGNVLLISFRLTPGGSLEPAGDDDRKLLFDISREAGGGEYAVGLRRLARGPRAEAVRRLKREVDPRGILPPVP